MPEEINTPEVGGLLPTTPKPFVFVLMPFSHEFDDTYKFGIKGAAEDAGAYAERVDEQYHDEGILERVYNQINKADVVIADMTGKNPNVFYEVGYAHALGKLVLLLTRDAEAIPFDLKHRPHIVYGDISELRNRLAPRLAWAIAESKRRKSASPLENFTVMISGVEVPESGRAEALPVVTMKRSDVYNIYNVSVDIRNGTFGTVLNFSHAYLFSLPDAPFKISIISPETAFTGRYFAHNLNAHPEDVSDGLSLQHILPAPPTAIPFAAIGSFTFLIETGVKDTLSQPLRLRLLRGGHIHDFSFRVEIGQSGEPGAVDEWGEAT